jgi:UDP-N-acetyl-D-glucosamine dehydrogenase
MHERVGIIGLGYVGLPLVIRFCQVGKKVIGFDIDSEKVQALQNGQSYISHIAEETIASLSSFEATDDMSRLGEPDALIVCVPTPITERREPDLVFVESTAETVAKYLRKGQLVSLESSTYPGTTREVVLPLLGKSGLKVGEDFYLVYSPEREDPGNETHTLKTIPKIVSGMTENCLRRGMELYSPIVDRIIQVSSPEVAEAAKILENTYRAVNIALVNELKVLLSRMGIDIWEVIDAAATKPFGFQAFYPGPGIGGHCIPVDPFYLTWKAKEFDFSTRFIELAGEINNSMPEYVISRIVDALNEREKSLKGSRILILGLSYKKDVDDLRESPSLRVIDLLVKKGAQVNYNDPYFPTFPSLRKFHFPLSSVPLTEENLSQHDCVVILTAHSSYDFSWIQKHAQLIVDTRNVVGGGNVVKA